MASNGKTVFMSEITEGVPRTVTWTLKNWEDCHEILVQEADCVFNVEDVKLRFFLRPFTKTLGQSNKDPAVTCNYYSLCVQVLSNQRKVCLKVATSFDCKAKYVVVKKSAENLDGVTIVDPEFFKIGGWYWRFCSSEIWSVGGTDFNPSNEEEFEINITTTLRQCIQQCDSNSKCKYANEQKVEKFPMISQQLLQHPENRFADVSLQMQDNVTIRSHRLILASASPVFEAMFLSDLKKTQTGIVEIADVSSDVMKVLIEYMHSGKVNPSSNQLIDQVIYAASKYQMDGLVKYFDNALITMCNPGNALRLLKLANKFNLSNASLDLQKYTELNALEIVMNQLQNA